MLPEHATGSVGLADALAVLDQALAERWFPTSLTRSPQRQLLVVVPRRNTGCTSACLATSPSRRRLVVYMSSYVAHWSFLPFQIELISLTRAGHTSTTL